MSFSILFKKVEVFEMGFTLHFSIYSLRYGAYKCGYLKAYYSKMLSLQNKKNNYDKWIFNLRQCSAILGTLKGEDQKYMS